MCLLNIFGLDSLFTIIASQGQIVWFVSFILYYTKRMYASKAEGFTAGELPQAGAVFDHFRRCRESSAIRPPCLCHHLLSWTLIPCRKGKWHNLIFSLSFLSTENQHKKQVYFIESKLEGCFSQPKKPPFFKAQLHGALVSQCSSLVFSLSPFCRKRL